MYIHIAVCDDEISVCNQIEQYITDFFQKKELHFHIDVFMSGESLLKALSNEAYDLVFLDIELPEKSGIQTASFIRNEQNNNDVQIVYISAVQSYAMELFEARPLHFLVKPLTSAAVEKVLQTFLRLYGETETFFTFQVNGHFHKLALKDILYFESHKRKVTVVTSKETYEFYDSLKNICRQISSPYFLLIHQSLLVNFQHITFFEYDRITLSDKEVLPVSQSRRSEVRSRYLALMTEAGKGPSADRT